MTTDRPNWFHWFPGSAKEPGELQALPAVGSVGPRINEEKTRMQGFTRPVPGSNHRTACAVPLTKLFRIGVERFVCEKCLVSKRIATRILGPVWM